MTNAIKPDHYQNGKLEFHDLPLKDKLANINKMIENENRAMNYI